MVSQLINWNQHPKRDSIEHDKRFVHAFLYVCAKERLANDQISKQEMVFVRGRFFRL